MSQANAYPDSKVHGTNMGLIWGRQDPGGPMLAPWILLSGYSFIITTPVVDIFAPYLGEYSIKPTRMFIGYIYWLRKYFDLFCFHFSNSLE